MLKRLALACVTAVTVVTAEKIPVLLVADVGIDDAAALLWLLRSPSIELLGIALPSAAAASGRPRALKRTAARAVRAVRRSVAFELGAERRRRQIYHGAGPRGRPRWADLVGATRY